jgi:hypothetical protein
LRKTEVEHLEIVRDKARLESYTQTVEARLNEATSTIRTLTRENKLLRINSHPHSNSSEECNSKENSDSNMTDSTVNSSKVGNHGQASHSPANPVTVIINNKVEKESPPA